MIMNICDAIQGRHVTEYVNQISISMNNKVFILSL